MRLPVGQAIFLPAALAASSGFLGHRQTADSGCVSFVVGEFH
jgi:F0F1-type ATP synthase assembly protein I